MRTTTHNQQPKTIWNSSRSDIEPDPSRHEVSVDEHPQTALYAHGREGGDHLVSISYSRSLETITETLKCKYRFIAQAFELINQQESHLVLEQLKVFHVI